jgi:mRNA interferase RelE/StbE
LPYKVLLDPRAAKIIQKLDEQTKTRIKKTLSELADNPYTAGEPIHPSEYWKIKTGDYRTIYQIDQNTKRVIVVFVGHRKNVYDNFSKLI